MSHADQLKIEALGKCLSEQSKVFAQTTHELEKAILTGDKLVQKPLSPKLAAYINNAKLVPQMKNQIAYWFRYIEYLLLEKGYELYPPTDFAFVKGNGVNRKMLIFTFESPNNVWSRDANPRLINTHLTLLAGTGQALTQSVFTIYCLTRFIKHL